MTTTNHCVPTSNGVDANRIMAKQYAEVHRGAYLEASDEVRKVIDDMARIYNNPNTDPADRESALDTLTDALFPQMHEGVLGVDLEKVKLTPKDGTNVEHVCDEMAEEESSFAARLLAEMNRLGVDQIQLAAQTGVGQPAISMMLSRNCRPQKRTVKKIADALGVPVDQLWPRR